MINLILNFLLCVYGGSVISYFISFPLYFHLLEKKKKKLGFVNVNGSTFEKWLLESDGIIRCILAIAIGAFIPGLNFIPFKALIHFEKEVEEDIATELKYGEIVLKEEAPKDEAEEIAKKIIAIRKYQGEMQYKNIPFVYSEYTIDQKIAFLLRELELLYREKAEAEDIDVEDIDVEEKISFCQSADEQLNQELKTLQKRLQENLEK